MWSVALPRRDAVGTHGVGLELHEPPARVIEHGVLFGLGDCAVAGEAEPGEETVAAEGAAAPAVADESVKAAVQEPKAEEKAEVKPAEAAPAEATKEDATVAAEEKTPDKKHHKKDE